MVKNPYRFYTYAYLREDKTPYYIGKGEGKRLYKKGKKEIKPPKDKSRIIFLKQNLNEGEAFKHEIYMIAVFGRKDLGTGILHNRTNGGDGVSGYIFTEEHRRKIGENGMGRIPWNKGIKMQFSEEARKNISEAQKNRKGRKVSEETKNKISIKHKGKVLSEETKKKLSEINEGKKVVIAEGCYHHLTKKYEIVFQNHQKIIIHGKLNWCKNNGYNANGLYKVQTKKWKRYKDIISVREICDNNLGPLKVHQ